MAIEDLSFTQLNEQRENVDLFFVGEDFNGRIGVLMSLSALFGREIPATENMGVVGTIVLLREVAAKAQKQANANAALEEQLQAFPPTEGGQTVDGYLEQISQIKSRLDISSANNILGATQ